MRLEVIGNGLDLRWESIYCAYIYTTRILTRLFVDCQQLLFFRRLRNLVKHARVFQNCVIYTHKVAIIIPRQLLTTNKVIAVARGKPFCQSIIQSGDKEQKDDTDR